MLIVTNGDVAAARIRGLGLNAEVLPWRDVLHEGPIRRGSLEEQSAARAPFLAQMSGRSIGEVSADLAARDATFAAACAAGRVELWFEHDLCDQLQLAQILDAAARLTPRPDLHLVQTDALLAKLDDRAFQALPAKAALVAEAAYDHCQTVWAAFASTDPREINRMARLPAPLPHMTKALRRLLAEYPDIRTGLPATLGMAASFLFAGPMPLSRLFAQLQDAEDDPFMGDVSFARLIDDIAQAPRRLLATSDGARLAPIGPNLKDGLAQTAILAPFGFSVLTGAENHVAANGIDRWIGGVHLEGSACYWHSGEIGALMAPTGEPLGF